MTMDPTQPVAPVSSPSPASSPTPALEPVAQVAPVGPVVAVRPRSRSGGLINGLLLVAAALAVGGVAFAVGRSTAPATAFQGLPGGSIVRPDGSFTPGAGGPDGGFGLNGDLAVDGTVTAVDADSITLTLANGEDMTFTLDSDTKYHEATDATATDVAVGDDVSVQVGGDGRVRGGNGDGTTPELTAGDVTVSR